ncbi:hypothetical protein [Pseudorhodoplanes sp.]|uniref:hypothetical protein n=1 Tax=Pseudorhodoplanes sp. TaxID=1934341 RepID=UPI002C83AD22|nr:hypothetical protein [Pseudorhodoplanes sp.]HWV41963.1 hypothetical protein [Pseudorhodoplanes sp.]
MDDVIKGRNEHNRDKTPSNHSHGIIPFAAVAFPVRIAIRICSDRLQAPPTCSRHAERIERHHLITLPRRILVPAESRFKERCT